MAESRARRLLRWLLAAAYLAAGVLHMLYPDPFLKITPHWVPMPATVIALTGLCEIAGAVGLAQPLSRALRRAAGWGLALYATCVFPANINHMLMDFAEADHGAGWIYHGPRMILQPILIWLALWTAHVTDWPSGEKS